MSIANASRAKPPETVKAPQQNRVHEVLALVVEERVCLGIRGDALARNSNQQEQPIQGLNPSKTTQIQIRRARLNLEKNGSSTFIGQAASGGY